MHFVAGDMRSSVQNALTPLPRLAYKGVSGCAIARRIMRGTLAAGSLELLLDRVSMANTSSAKKAVRKIERRTAVNRARRSQMRTYLRKVEEALASGDGTAATSAFEAAAPLVMRAAQKGILHKNTASRKISRLSKRVKSLAG